MGEGRHRVGVSFPQSTNTRMNLPVNLSSRDWRMAQTVIADDSLATREDAYTVGLDDQGRFRISPTDVSQFIRLDQCEERSTPGGHPPGTARTPND